MAIGVRLGNLIKRDLFCPIVQNYFFSLIMYVWASMFTASLEIEPCFLEKNSKFWLKNFQSFWSGTLQNSRHWLKFDHSANLFESKILKFWYVFIIFLIILIFCLDICRNQSYRLPDLVTKMSFDNLWKNSLV